MNLKQLILLLAALAVIGGASLLLIHRHTESWDQSDTQLGGKLLKNFQVNDVADIHIEGDGSLDLVHKDDRWRVAERGDYPANFSQISDLLIKMSDLKVIQSEPAGPGELAGLHLDKPGTGPDGAVLVEFKNDKGTVMDSLLVGKKHVQKPDRPSPMSFGDDGDADGRYVMLKSDPNDVLTISDPLNSVAARPAEWLNKDFFKVEKPESISFISTNAAQSWTIQRATESSPWVMADVKPGEVVDTNKLSSMSSTLSWPSFVDVATNKAGMEKPLEVVIKTFDHFTYTLKIGAKNKANDYDLNVHVTADLTPPAAEGKKEKPADNKKLEEKLAQEQALAPWVYQVNSWLVEPLIRDRSQLMVEKKEARKTATNTATTPATEASIPDAPFDATPISQ